jgi:hypothetical protein
MYEARTVTVGGGDHVPYRTVPGTAPVPFTGLLVEFPAEEVVLVDFRHVRRLVVLNHGRRVQEDLVRIDHQQALIKGGPVFRRCLSRRSRPSA